MNIFLSWAGESSKHIAAAFYEWLPDVLTYLDPWMSTRMEKGDAWDGSIAAALYDTPVALICLTPESLSSGYLHYEAGAISNVKEAKVCTFLFGLTPSDVNHPLARFQHTIYDKNDVHELLKTINSIARSKGERALTDEKLRKTLDKHWDDLVVDLNATPKIDDTLKPRKDREILEEILTTVRTLTIPAKGSSTTKTSDTMLAYLYALAKDFQRAQGLSWDELENSVPAFRAFISKVFNSAMYGAKPTESDIKAALTLLRAQKPIE